MKWTDLNPFTLRPVRSDIGARRIGYASKRGTNGRNGVFLVQWKARTYVASPVDRCDYDRIVALDQHGVLRDSQLRAILENARLACQVSPAMRRLR